MNDSVKKQSFDFSEWSDLAAKDPKAFEKRREQTIEAAILAMPGAKQQRIRALQWRIDQERKRSKSPMAACIRLSNMMWENLLGENGLLDNLRYVDHDKIRQPVRKTSANILEFPQQFK
jgi:hypothetical protein